ncbi:MAG TPA: DinB family protein [Vicinamibacterales bacterium]|jgi:uncharacterized damage-inducible protein DinB
MNVTYYGSKHIADSFRTVRKNTLTIANEIPEDQYGFRTADGAMSVGELLAHIAISPMWQIDVHGKKIAAVDFAYFGAHQQQAKLDEAALRTKADIVRALTEHGETFAAFVEGLDEAALASTVTFPPPIQPSTKSRFEMLLGPKEHEMHHRAQLMMVQRMIGQVPELTRRRQAFQTAARAQAQA